MARTPLLAALPQVFVAGAESGPLAGLVAAGDGMHQPASDVLDHLEERFDPMTASDSMVCYLASWVDLDWLTLPESPTRARSTLPGGAAPLRDLLVESADLAARRGTASGMVRFLELATRRTGFAVADAGGFHLRVTLPVGADDLAETTGRIVAAIRPAHITAEVLVAQEPPAAEPPGPEPDLPTTVATTTAEGHP